MFLDILQRVNSRREDEEHGCSWTRLLKGDGEVQGSANHVLVSQFLLDKISVGGNTTQFLNTILHISKPLLADFFFEDAKQT